MPLERFEVMTLNDWFDHYTWKYALLGPLVDVQPSVADANKAAAGGPEEEADSEWRVLSDAAAKG